MKESLISSIFPMGHTLRYFWQMHMRWIQKVSTF